MHNPRLLPNIANRYATFDSQSAVRRFHVEHGLPRRMNRLAQVSRNHVFRPFQMWRFSEMMVRHTQTNRCHSGSLQQAKPDVTLPVAIPLRQYDDCQFPIRLKDPAPNRVVLFILGLNRARKFEDAAVNE